MEFWYDRATSVLYTRCSAEMSPQGGLRDKQPPLAIFNTSRSQSDVENNFRLPKHHVFPMRLFTTEREGYILDRADLETVLQQFVHG